MTDPHVVWGEVEKVSGSGSSSYLRDASSSSLRRDVTAGVVFKNQDSSSSSLSPSAPAKGATPRAPEGLDLRLATLSESRPASASAEVRSLARRVAQQSSAAASRDSATAQVAPPPSAPATQALQCSDPARVHKVVHDIFTEADLWSVGSELHAKGSCKPCHYIHTMEGCRCGVTCPYCHFPHTDSRTVRGKLCMSKRLHCKRIATTLETELAHDLVMFRNVMQVVSVKSTYLRSALEERLRALEMSTAPSKELEFSHVHGAAEESALPASRPEGRRKNIESL